MRGHLNVGSKDFCNLFTFYIPVNTDRIAYGDRIKEINAALDQLFSFLDKLAEATILLDSRAALCR